MFYLCQHYISVTLYKFFKMKLLSSKLVACNFCMFRMGTLLRQTRTQTGYGTGVVGRIRHRLSECPTCHSYFIVLRSSRLYMFGFYNHNDSGPIGGFLLPFFKEQLYSVIFVHVTHFGDQNNQEFIQRKCYFYHENV